MSQQHINAILNKVQKDWSCLQNVEQIEEYANLTPEEKSAFLNLNIVQAQKFLDSASIRHQNTQALAVAQVV
ncbi:MAG: hypothetical protein ACRDEA_05960, partial [Microcystaceae cyanobacterium]